MTWFTFDKRVCQRSYFCVKCVRDILNIWWDLTRYASAGTGALKYSLCLPTQSFAAAAAAARLVCGISYSHFITFRTLHRHRRQACSRSIINNTDHKLYPLLRCDERNYTAFTHRQTKNQPLFVRINTWYDGCTEYMYSTPRGVVVERTCVYTIYTHKSVRTDRFGSYLMRERWKGLW